MSRLNSVLTASLFYVVAVGTVVAGCSTDPERAKAEYLSSGDRFTAQAKYSEAIVQYRNALQYDQRFGDARLKLARAYEKLGDSPNAFREYVRAADALPNSVEAQVKAGTYLLRARQFEEARVRAEKALKLDAKNVEALVVLGNSLGGLRQFDEAIAELEEAIKLDPGATTARTSVGAMQMAQGNAADAEAAFRRAVEANPKSADAHMSLGAFLWSLKRHADAEAALKKALSLQPANQVAHRALATFYLAIGKTRDAEPHLRALADADQTPAAPWKLALADYYVVINRPELATKVLDEVGKSAGATAAATTRRAAITYANENKAEGRKAIDDLLARDASNVPALLMKTRFLMDEGKLDDALATAQAATAAEQQSIQARYLVGVIRRAQRRPLEAIEAFNEVLRINPSATAAQMQLAELSLQQGKAAEALLFATEAARRVPDDFRIQLTVVQSLLAAGQVREAHAKISPLLKAVPANAAVQATAGTVALARRDIPGARRLYARALELDSSNLSALNGLVRIDLAEKKIGDATARIERLLSSQPDRPEVLLLAARVYGLVGDQKRVDELLQKAVEVDPSNLEAYSMLGQLYARQRRLPEARASFETILSKRPESIAAQTVVAVLYEVEGNRVEARKRYERILQQNRDSAVAANNLAYLYAEDGGNLDLALQMAQTAKRALPENADVADTLGWIYVKKDLPVIGIPQLEEATKKSPTNPLFQYHLGVAYAKGGDQARAREALQRALALKLEPVAAADATKLLESL